MAGPVIRGCEDRVAYRILGLDISTRAGWAVIEPHPVVVGPEQKLTHDVQMDLVAYGAAQNADKVSAYGPYPWSYLRAADALVGELSKVLYVYRPDVVVIEETNGSRSRYTQKILEFLHYHTLELMQEYIAESNPKYPPQVVYLNTSDWRRTLGLALTREQKNLNATLGRAKRGGAEKLAAKKAALGVRGKTNKKHLSVAWAQQSFGLTLLQKQNDEAEAMALCVAWASGCSLADGVK